MDSPLVLLNLIAIFRIKSYEDFDINFSLMGMSIDVFHFMGKSGLGFAEIGINIFLYKWVNEFQSHFIWEEEQNNCCIAGKCERCKSRRTCKGSL